MKSIRRLLPLGLLVWLASPASLPAAEKKPRAQRPKLAKPFPPRAGLPLEEPPEPEAPAVRRRAEEGPGDSWTAGVKLAFLFPSFSDQFGWHNRGYGTTFEVGERPIATGPGFLTELYAGCRWLGPLSTGLFMSVHGYPSDVPHDEDFSLGLAFGLRLKLHLTVADTIEIRPVASASWGLGILGGIGADPVLPIGVENRAGGALLLQGAIEGVYAFSERLGLLADVGLLAVPYAFQNVLIESGGQAVDLFRVESHFGPVFYVSAGIEFKL